ncbi:unnamed protein product [Rotaria sordida]|uniref:Uncharacterized protein n=1 Tax=Rotaria sordida TaxID=392033 RepID=A0A819THE4_9BILA|nr:unnamed protein product [Rotaria sordida]CAF4078297.1 unnamed protein product [Rotaria sordida]
MLTNKTQFEMFIYIISNLSHVQPDDNDDGENFVPLANVETIDTVQGRQYRTALQQLKDLFWPVQKIHHSIINNNQLNEHEQQTTNVQQSLRVHENN